MGDVHDVALALMGQNSITTVDRSALYTSDSPALGPVP